MTDDESALERYRIELTSLAAQFGLGEQDIEQNSYLKLFEQHAKTSA